jgi:hypothetical protein
MNRLIPRTIASSSLCYESPNSSRRALPLTLPGGPGFRPVEAKFLSVGFSR